MLVRGVELWVNSIDPIETRMNTNDLAEGVRFELTKALTPRQFSRLVHSTALPTFRSRNYT